MTDLVNRKVFKKSGITGKGTLYGLKDFSGAGYADGTGDGSGFVRWKWLGIKGTQTGQVISPSFLWVFGGVLVKHVFDTAKIVLIGSPKDIKAPILRLRYSFINRLVSRDCRVRLPSTTTRCSPRGQWERAVNILSQY